MDPSVVAAGPVAVPANHHLAHMIRFRKKVDELKKMVDELKPRIVDLTTRIRIAKNNREEIFLTVEAWLEKAEAAQAKTSQLHVDVLKINSCFTGWFFQRYRLGNEAHMEIAIVGQILVEGNNLLNREISYKREIEAVPVQGFEVFGSRESLKHEILEGLKVNQMVGVWGMGGIGKTTLMKHILEHVKNVYLFDKVAMAVVSQLPKLKEIQTRIAEQLDLKFHGESIESRAAELYSRLSLGNNLVLLDDIWDELNLQDLGIPYGDTSKGCKLVLTTRSLEVCYQMNAQAKIEVKILSSQESWDLFERTVGDYESNTCREVAKKIVTECKGLPLAIVVLAKCLRKKGYDTWVNAAKELKRSNFDGMSQVFTVIKYSYDKLETIESKLCFLFFCSYPEDAMITIDGLLGYINGEEIFHDAKTLDDLRRRLTVQVDKLTSSCLLLEDKNNGDVTVHDIIRDVGISIAKESNGFMIKAGMGIKEWPTKKITEACLRMSLMKNAISNLKGTSECSQLSLLNLAENESLTSISDGFFKSMQNLVTLDLSRTRIPSLPQAISCLRTLLLNKCSNLKDISGVGSLTQLEILDLSECDIRRLPEEMKSLTKLKLLNLSYNENLTVIPLNVISSLSFLEELYMFKSFSHWNIEGKVNQGTASFSELLSLPRLSTLHVGTNEDSLVYMDYPHKLMKLSKFIINLNSLWVQESDFSKSLCIKVNDHKRINEWVKVLWEVSDELILEDSDMMEGIFTNGDVSLSKLKALKIVHSSLINLPSELMINLHNLESIGMYSCNNLKVINWEGDVRQLKVMCNNLETIKINECKNMEVLFDFRGLREEEDTNTLSKLRKIDLTDMGRLKKIWKGCVSFESIHNLKEMTVCTCPMLSYLFPISMVHRLKQLKILKIELCDEMVQMFGSEEEEVNEIRSDPQPSRITARLPRLKFLRINTTKLSNLSISCPSLQTLGIWECDRLEEVFKEDDSATLLSPLLTKIELYKLPKLSTIWKGFIPVGSFQNLKEVEIYECKSLSYIFPVSAVMSLQQLEILEIQYCSKMIHIFDSDEEEKEERETEETVDEIIETNCCMIEKFGIRRRRRDREPSAIGDINDGQPSVIKAVLPRLKTLRLESLIKLSGFCQSNSCIIFFPSLEQLGITNCNGLKKLPFDRNSSPKLKKFEATSYWFYRLQWDDQDTQARLQSIGKILEENPVCDYCKKDITKEICVNCVECCNFDLCIECFSIGVEVLSHKRNHPYRVLDNLSGPLITPEWSADEEALLLEGIELHGLVNWAEVATHVGTKSLVKCIDHYPKTKLKMGQSVEPFLARPQK